MPYIGNELATQFQAFVTQTITGDGSTGYTLDRAVANGKELLVYINNVKQEEGSGKSYTASGTTITFSDAVASTDSCYVVFLGSAVQTVVPSDGSLASYTGNASISGTLGVTGAVTANAGISVDNITIDGTEIDLSSGDLTVDVAGDIILDAGGGDVKFKDDGVEFSQYYKDGNDLAIYSSISNGDIKFQGLDGSSVITPVTIDISEGGKVGIGETTPLANLHIKSADSGVTPSADSDELFLEGSGNSGITIGSGTSSSGAVRFADSGTDSRGFIIYNHSDETMAFGTAATEAFRINSAQDMTIGNNDPSDDTPNIGFQFDDGGGTSSFMNIGHTSGSGTADGYIRFIRNGSVIGQIQQNGNTNVQYSTSSDYRLKENIVTDWDATSRLKQLKPSRFNFKEDKGKTVDGFIAHEVSDIVPEAIGGEKDAMTKEVLYVEGDQIPEGKKVGDVKKPSKIDPQGIDQSKLVPLLTKALQEAISEIDTLKTKVTALEAK